MVTSDSEKKNSWWKPNPNVKKLTLKNVGHNHSGYIHLLFTAYVYNILISLPFILLSFSIVSSSFTLINVACLVCLYKNYTRQAFHSSIVHLAFLGGCKINLTALTTQQTQVFVFALVWRPMVELPSLLTTFVFVFLYIVDHMRATAAKWWIYLVSACIEILHHRVHITRLWFYN